MLLGAIVPLLVVDVAAMVVSEAAVVLLPLCEVEEPAVMLVEDDARP